MRKTLLSLLLSGLVGFSISAQTPDTTKLWTTGMKAALTFNQVSLTNWAAGGENSFGGNSFLNLFANLKQGKTTWDNNLDLGYGLVKLGDQKTRKSDDKIDFSSKLGHNVINKNLFLSANLGFKSQFAKGYNYSNDTSVLISKFAAPAYLMLGFGMEYKPNKYLSVSLLPITGRLTIVSDTTLSVAYGLDPGKTIRAEFGASAKITFEKDVLTNVSVKTKLELFTNYLEQPQNVDINWEALVILKVNKLISTYVGIQTIYDHDIQITDKDGKTGPRTQFKQTFGIGLSYSIKHLEATVKL